MNGLIQFGIETEYIGPVSLETFQFEVGFDISTSRSQDKMLDKMLFLFLNLRPVTHVLFVLLGGVYNAPRGSRKGR